MDSVIPATVDPTIRLVINLLVGLHILAFIVYVWLLLRSSNKTQVDTFREQYQKMDAAAKNKQRVGK